VDHTFTRPLLVLIRFTQIRRSEASEIPTNSIESSFHVRDGLDGQLNEQVDVIGFTPRVACAVHFRHTLQRRRGWKSYAYLARRFAMTKQEAPPTVETASYLDITPFTRMRKDPSSLQDSTHERTSPASITGFPNHSLSPSPVMCQYGFQIIFPP